MSQDRDRPLALTALSLICLVVGILLVLASLFLILGGALVAATGTADATTESPTASIAVGFLTLALAILYVVLSYGFWELRRWAWWLGIAALCVSLAGRLVGFPPGAADDPSAATSAVVSVIALVVLLMPSTRVAFGLRARSATAGRPESFEP